MIRTEDTMIFWFGVLCNITYLSFVLGPPPDNLAKMFLFLANMSVVIAFDTALIYTIIVKPSPQLYCPVCEEPVRQQDGCEYCHSCCSKVKGVKHIED